MEVYSNMGAKNTENMTQALEKTKKASKIKMCIVSCLGVKFQTKKEKRKKKTTTKQTSWTVSMLKT